jgi:hypothetical protein
MDQSQKENKNINIWNKFESAAPGVPDWIRNKEQTGIILQTLLKTITAKSILISTTREIFLQTGGMEAETNKKILQVLDTFWDPIQKSDLTRYLKNANGEVSGFIFSANLFQQLIITLYYQDTPTLSMARVHAKRIIRALSGQTVASYEAKTVPVDAAIAAQMQKIFEEKARQARELASSAGSRPVENEQELPIPAASLPDMKLQPAQAEAQPANLDDLMPSMDELLGQITTQEVVIESEPSSVNQEITSQVEIPDEITAIPYSPEEVISEADLAHLSEELDEFFMDDETDIDLEEQKEKLAALLQELPTPDPIDFENQEMNIRGDPNIKKQEFPQENGIAMPVETAPVDVEQAEKPQQSSGSFQQALQQAGQENTNEPRSFLIVILPRISLAELGVQFEKKIELYFQQACQLAQCQPESCQLFSDHIQLKIQLSGKTSIARTIMQIKKVLELRILENYATFTDELGGKELWIPGQLVFSDQEKMDNKRIQQFINNAQSQG